MTALQGVIVYGVCWWLIFFMALPIGVRPLENPPPGMSSALPQKPYLGIKALIVTILAGFATWGIDILLLSGIVPLR